MHLICTNLGGFEKLFYFFLFLWIGKKKIDKLLFKVEKKIPM